MCVGTFSLEHEKGLEGVCVWNFNLQQKNGFREWMNVYVFVGSFNLKQEKDLEKDYSLM
jgi:hypothetical protein